MNFYIMNLKQQILLIPALIFCLSINAQKQYYISSSKGDDSNMGSKLNPWKTLDKISNQKLKPGDTVFFKRGDTFKGHFVPNGSGSRTKPLVITAYGSGNQPIITGQVGSALGGDFREAIYVNNQDNMVFDGLEVQNNRTSDRYGIDSAKSFGINVHNTDNRVMSNFTFKNMTFRTVYALSYVNPVNQNAFNKFEVSALRFMSGWNKSNINNVLVEDCYFTDLQRIGVHIKHSKGNNGFDNRQTNFIFRSNEFYQIGGTCILPTRTRNCLIEYNIFNQPGAKTNERMIGRGSAVWNYYSVNTMIQYNQCIGVRGILDSHGIHIDHHNVDTVVQYNYMEDCEGGFVEILAGNERATYRFNISRNDGWRDNPRWKTSNHTLWLNNQINRKPADASHDSYIYNNTIIIDRKDKPYQTSIDIKGTGTRLFNNLFFAINGSGIGNKQMVIQDSLFSMTNNYFYGDISENFINKDQNKKEAHQLQIEINQDKINNLSELINAGISFDDEFDHPRFPVEASSIFSTVKPIPTSDFFGHTILADVQPNIGANNSKETKFVLSNSNLRIQNPIAIGAIKLIGVDKDYEYFLSDVLGRVQQNGTLSKGQSNIELKKELIPGRYNLKLSKDTFVYDSKLVVTH